MFDYLQLLWDESKEPQKAMLNNDKPFYS